MLKLINLNANSLGKDKKYAHASGHMRKDCTKYATWRVKKGIILTFVCSEASLSYAPVDTSWVDSTATTHVSVTMQGCLWSRPLSDVER